MKKIISKVIFIVVAIVLIYFLKTNFAEYNIEKSISACVLGEKRTSESFDLKKCLPWMGYDYQVKEDIKID